MTESVIIEIANQLGIAVDQASDFIQVYLPQYAALKAWQIGIGMFIFTAVLVVVSMILYRGYKTKKNFFEDSFGAFIVMIFLAFGWLIWLCLFVCFVPEMIGWIVCPEGQLISECMNFGK